MCKFEDMSEAGQGREKLAKGWMQPDPTRSFEGRLVPVL